MNIKQFLQTYSGGILLNADIIRTQEELHSFKERIYTTDNNNHEVKKRTTVK